MIRKAYITEFIDTKNIAERSVAEDKALSYGCTEIIFGIPPRYERLIVTTPAIIIEKGEEILSILQGGFKESDALAEIDRLEKDNND
ncbi:hypothetical protein HYS94_01510 [Candidatus Daviesbacteria bacterium]|nr:hypothetical protein [Candidatus Daviesbacteria bacterium]